VSNVVSLSGNSHPSLGVPCEHLISLLEQLLAKAQSGELQSFVGTGFVADGARLSIFYEGEPDLYSMLGAIAWLQHEYVAGHTEAE
jgi:hypothetical protein